MTHRQTIRVRVRVLTLLILATVLHPLLAVAIDGGSPTDMRETVEANEYDERTLLDTFGAVAKQYLTQKLIPETDVECRWDWRYVRCEPFCECEFQFRMGDYHLGRSCRRKEKEDCDPEEFSEAKHLQLMIQRIVQRSQKLVRAVRKKTRNGYERVQNNVCTRLPEINCSEGTPVLAWQERLLCRSMIPDCSGTSNDEKILSQEKIETETETQKEEKAESQEKIQTESETQTEEKAEDL